MGNAFVSAMLQDRPFLNSVLVTHIVIEYISKFSSQQGKWAKDFLEDFEEPLRGIGNIQDIEEFNEIRFFFQQVVSIGPELKVFFTVPNQQIMSNVTPTLNLNQVDVAFVNFLLLMVEAVLHLDADPSVKCLIQNLRTELGFLITFLGDIAMHLHPSTNIVIEIEAAVNEVGSFLYSFFVTMVVYMRIHGREDETSIEAMVSEVGRFLNSNLVEPIEDLQLQAIEVEQIKNSITDFKALVHKVASFIDFMTFPENDQVQETGKLDLALSKLLLVFEILKTKIKEHCIIVSKNPSTTAPKTTECSLFIVDSVLDDLMYLINNKPDSIVGVTDEIVRLRQDLTSLRSHVTGIAAQQEVEPGEIVIQIRDIAYEVEYVINSFPPIWYLKLRLPQLIEKIQLILTAIKEMTNDNDISEYQGEQVKYKEPPILDDLVGFDNVTTEITQQLVGQIKHLQIISIVGMPGLGKTTLANKLYNHPPIIRHFYLRVWCVVSQTYNKKNMLIDILCSIKNVKRETLVELDDQRLGENLYKSLKGRRYLVVMDDIWGRGPWEDLRRYFPNDENQSRILITSRNKEAVPEASHHCVINELPFLSEDECWELLQRKVFRGENSPQELLDAGKQIATSSRGLTLAVVTISGVLANMEKKEYLWQKVASNLSSHIYENANNCIHILELSYKYLPMHLKPCFLYFGMYKEDTEIPIRRSIQIWVAEGFILKRDQDESLDDVALKYMMELINRSLVLAAKRGSNGKVKTSKIHDLLLQMCVRIAGENNFLKAINIDIDDPSFSPVLMYQEAHCLKIKYGDCSFPYLSPPFGPHVRSLLCAYHMFPKLFSCNFKVVRVLLCYGDVPSNVILGIEHLVHLRLLSIACKLPPMESFHKLEYLNVDNTNEVEVPDPLLNMMSLRDMRFTGGAYFSDSLRRRAAEDESFLVSNSLESISVLSISDEVDVKILTSSPKLRRLKGEVGFSLYCSFNLLNQLESLHLWYDDRIRRDSGTIMVSLSLNLRKLTLVHVNVSPKQMEIIGELQHLEVLKLEEVVFESGQWEISEDEFQELKFLKLHKVRLTEWNASGDHFPMLERLVLQHCKHLQIGSLGDIPTLLVIEVDSCTEAITESAKQIMEEQRDIGNDELKIIISGSQIESESEEESEDSESDEDSENEEEIKDDSESDEDSENEEEIKDDRESEEESGSKAEYQL